jgi:hypothetical protein
MRVKKDMHVENDAHFPKRHVTNDMCITIDPHSHAKCTARAVWISGPAHRQRFTRVIVRAMPEPLSIKVLA